MPGKQSAPRSLWPVFALAVPGACCQPGVSVLVRLPGLSGEVKVAWSERRHAAHVCRDPPARGESRHNLVRTSADSRSCDSRWRNKSVHVRILCFKKAETVFR